ncbi:MAG: DUF4129 domain-containing protein [Thaumarchaeota archaeon]|nr:DUF4129 domain-containing protein [Nitrososphaerota archaeon]
MEIILVLPYAALDYRIWQGIYATMFSLAAVAVLGLVAPFAASSDLFKPLFRRHPVRRNLSLISLSRAEEVLKELEDARQKKEWRLGIISVYQSIRRDLAASASVKLKKELTEHEVVERLMWSRGLGSNASQLRQLYLLYEKAKFSAEPVGESELDHAKRIIVDLSSQLKPVSSSKEDVGQP